VDEFFKGIGPIGYEGPQSTNALAFKWYNAKELLLGKTMQEHLRFAVAFWHTLRGSGADPFGAATISRPWDDGSDSVDNALRRMRANFEFVHKLGLKYYCLHDRDIAPEGESWRQTNQNLDALVALAKQLQGESGIKLLWGTANLFSHPRYMCGAATNPDAAVFATAAAQVKKAMEVTAELGGENYVFWGGREGYQSLLNTNMQRELDHLARFLQMAVDYKKQLGFGGTLLIEPKPKEPTKHQYDFDAATVIGFLRTYGLDKEFKLNVEANHATLAGHSFEHELQTAADAGMLGSIDANTGDALLGWDTDQFCMDVRSAALAMVVVLEQGGLGSGGLNFDAKLRRESTDVEDLFIAHIGGMDTFARGLRIAASIVEEGELSALLKARYGSFDNGIGRQIELGEVGFEELEQHILQQGLPQPRSAKQEFYEMVLNKYL
jgi:xylose isomerase